MKRLGLALAAAVLLVACGDGGTTGTTSAGGSGGDTSTGGSGGTTATGGNGGDTSSGGSGGDTSTGGSGGSTTSAGGGGAGGGEPVGACGRRCTTDVECCPDGVANCPGPYPYNYKCEDLDNNGEKTCTLPQCTVDDDCNPGGVGLYACKAIGSTKKVCVLPCQSDGECGATTSCIGVADDNTKFCSVEPQPFTCSSAGMECFGFGVCAASGDKCVCTADDQCEDTYYTKDCVNVGN